MKERFIQGFFLWGHLTEADHLEDPDVDGDNIKMDLRGQGWGARTASVWLRVGTGGWLL
jgi:hypothetical protein